MSDLTVIIDGTSYVVPREVEGKGPEAVRAYIEDLISPAVEGPLDVEDVLYDDDSATE